MCLFDATGRQVAACDLPACDDGVWHGYLPGAASGLLYGYRAHGAFDPAAGKLCNPHKLLIDPCARELHGEFSWHAAVHGQVPGKPGVQSTLDSAAFVPRCRLRADDDNGGFDRPLVPWAETILYEANVRGYTMQHPAIDASLRGTFDGMRHAAVLAHIKALGITTVELMPVHAFVDERHLVERGLRNLWGYNTCAFFAPMPRYGRADPVREFRDMLRAFHDAGLEVLLDVVYNHTAEGDADGPTLGFRGLDNLAYYRTEPDNPASYINDTGCGNTINADHPEVQRLVIDSLIYWHRTMGVDGFRFDLAPILGRHADGFSSAHPLLAAIEREPALAGAKLIAEPWDPGPGGYQLGAFPGRFAEWNDRFRDSVRRFWRGDGDAAEFATRMRASADIFDHNNRPATASVNFVASHDGFTLLDTVSYAERHNEANGEDNRDGHAHNCSSNHGEEGPSQNPDIIAARRRQRLNMLASLLFAQGTPMLLAGDEFGNGQSGNNNAYAQDNAIGWVDWSGLEADPEFFAAVRQLVAARRSNALLRAVEFIHTSCAASGESPCVEWLNVDGVPLAEGDWPALELLHLRIAAGQRSTSVLVNRTPDPAHFRVGDDTVAVDADGIALWPGPAG